MHGNVFEWCRDQFGEFGKAPQTDPKGAQGESVRRIYRGGCLSYADVESRSANRSHVPPSYAYTVIGFRLALVRVDVE